MNTSTFPTQIPFGPLVDPQTGRATMSWILFFNQIFKRIGAETGFNSGAAMASDQTLQQTVTVLQGNAAYQNGEINALMQDIAALTDQIAIMSGEVETARMSALNAARIAMQARDDALLALFEG